MYLGNNSNNLKLIRVLTLYFHKEIILFGNFVVGVPDYR